MNKFEYKILNIAKAHLKKEAFQGELINTLNNLGAEGWELINAEGLNEGTVFLNGSETVDILLFFKRSI